MMHRPTRLKITDVNPHLICILCGGYLIDATTMIECLHSYCRACIVAYLRQSRQCPICDTVVHKTRPLLNIRSDKTLQNLVYKLVPNLFKDEMKRRRDFYSKHPQASTSMQSPNAREERGEVCEDSLVIYTEDEYISLSLDYYFAQPRKEDRQKANGEGDTNANGKRPHGDTNGLPGDVVEKRYLRCPAAVCITHIKKFIRNKFGLSSAHRIEVVHQNGEDEPLRDDYTLMDIAYIYTWRRNGPLPLLFRVFEPFSKRRKGSQSSVSSCDSVPAKVASPRPSPPPARRHDTPSKSPSPLSLQDKEKHFQKPHAKVKPPSEIIKVPAQPTKPPAEIPGPSGKSVSHVINSPSQKTLLVKKPEKVYSTEKPNMSSAHAVTQISPAKPSGKTIIVVTSANPVSTSSKNVTSVSLMLTSPTNTLSSVATVAKSSSLSKTDQISSNAKTPAPKLVMLSSTPDMTSSRVVMMSSDVAVTSSKAAPTASKTEMVSPVSDATSNMTSSKATVISSKSGMTSSKPDMTSPKPDMLTKHNIASASSKADMAPPKPLMTSSKPDMTSQKPNMTAPKADTTPPIVFTLSNTVLAPLKLDEKADDKNTSVPNENPAMTVANATVTSPAQRNDGQVAKPCTPILSPKVVATQQPSDEIKTDQPPVQVAVVKEDTRPRPQTETTPTKNNTVHEAPIDVSVPEGVMIDRPVLLQT